MSDTYRVAIIGCGGRGAEHALGMRAEPRAKVVALADIKREAAEKLNEANAFGAALYEDYREMLARERPDVVATCLWTKLHFPVFRDCVEAGARAVLSEKPMSPTWGECRAMAALAESSGCQLTFCHQRRFASGNLLARQLIQEGRFGKIERMDLYSPPHLLDCGTHTVDQAMSFNAESPARWVLGAVDGTAPISYFEIDAESMAVGTIVFENGVRASLQVGGPDMDIGGGVRVIGTEGYLEVTWDGQFRRCVVYSDPAYAPPVATSVRGEAMVGVVRNAFDCLESGAEPELSHKKAYRATEVLFALYESARRRQRMTLPLPEELTDNPFAALLQNGAFPASEAGVRIPAA